MSNYDYPDDDCDECEKYGPPAWLGYGLTLLVFFAGFVFGMMV